MLNPDIEAASFDIEVAMSKPLRYRRFVASFDIEVSRYHIEEFDIEETLISKYFDIEVILQYRRLQGSR